MMNGTSQLPAWFGLSLRVGAFVIAGLLAFTTLQGNVKAIDTRVTTIEDEVARHKEQMDLMREIQIRVVVTLEQMSDDISEIKDDLKEHKDHAE
jgi:septation ring formation regulator EzrA